MKELIRVLKPIAHSWSDLGRELEVSFAYRQQLHHNRSFQSSTDKLESVLHQWIEERSSEVSWKHLIEALNNLEHHDIADKVKDHLSKFGLSILV